MKKFLFYSFVICLFEVSCSESEELPCADESSQTQYEIRNFEEALQVALTSIDIVDNQSTTRGLSKKRELSLSDRKVIEGRFTRSSGSVLDTLMYVFNFKDSMGFALVAGPKNIEGLLAVTENGYYDPDIPCQIEGFNDFVKKAKTYCLNAYYNQESEAEEDARMERSPIGSNEEYMDSVWYEWPENVLPLMPVLWGQYFPEGEFCSNGVSGCTNTAMAQIMAYYQYPDTIQLTYPDADKAFEVLNWTNMRFHHTGHPLGDCSTPETHKSIGRLLRQIGHLNQSYYDPGDDNYPAETGANVEQHAESTFNALGYNTGTWSDYNRIAACASLSMSRPLLLAGFHNWIYGHTWVLDGYFKQTQYIQRMRRINNSAWFPIGSPRTSSSYYMHHNWGWYGDCNGYFLSGIFTTNAAFAYQSPYTRNNDYYFAEVKMLSVFH